MKMLMSSFLQRCQILKTAGRELGWAAFLLLCFCFTARAEIRVPHLFGDNMVLQQSEKTRFWGWAEPGEKVTVSLGEKSAQTVTNKQGRWEVFFDLTEPHHSPAILQIKGNHQTLTFSNVLVGEVWLAAGQSNMGLPLIESAGGKAEVQKANYPEMRFFQVGKQVASTPQDDVEGAWVACTPENAEQFSAVAYFFARSLQQKIARPIGLILSSWGGTKIEAWASRETFTTDRLLEKVLTEYERKTVNLALAEHNYTLWASKYLNHDAGNKGFGLGYAREDYDASGWAEMKLPRLWESVEGMNIDGAVWFRRDIEVPADWAGRELSLRLGPIDDYDITYFNARQIGSTGPEEFNAYVIPRTYKVPASLVKAGRNTIAVRVFDRLAGGGFAGVPSEMTLRPINHANGKQIFLAGLWRYKVEQALRPAEPDYASEPPQPLRHDSPHTPGSLYNAMISPMTSFTIRGVIWYQGESNVGRASAYRQVFPAMITEWRRKWKQAHLPFLFVQLPAFLPPTESPAESRWAELREAQRAALRLEETGMAVTTDIGDQHDLHPKNKQEVGRRLALIALNTIYGEQMEFYGPLYHSFQIEGDHIRIKFTHVNKDITTAFGDKLKGFTIAGTDRKFHPAQAILDGESIIVRSPDVAQPVSVRYAWADNPQQANLTNISRLPASPFTTEEVINDSSEK